MGSEPWWGLAYLAHSAGQNNIVTNSGSLERIGLALDQDAVVIGKTVGAARLSA